MPESQPGSSSLPFVSCLPTVDRTAAMRTPLVSVNRFAIFCHMFPSTASAPLNASMESMTEHTMR